MIPIIQLPFKFNLSPSFLAKYSNNFKNYILSGNL